MEEPLLRRSSCFFFRYNHSSNSLQLLEEPPTDPSNSEVFILPKNAGQRSTRRRIHRMEPRAKRALTVGCVLMFFQQITGFNAFMYYATIIFANLKVENPLIPAMAVAFTNFIFTFVALKLVDSVGRRSTLLCTVFIMIIGL